MEDDGRQHVLNENEDACVSIKWSGEFERRLPAMVEIVLKLAAHEPIEDVLAIQIGARVAPLEDDVTMVVSKNIGRCMRFPSDLWIKAERAHWKARLALLKAGETYPPSGPFFYDEESGDPIEVHEVFGALSKALKD